MMYYVPIWFKFSIPLTCLKSQFWAKFLNIFQWYIYQPDVCFSLSVSFHCYASEAQSKHKMRHDKPRNLKNLSSRWNLTSEHFQWNFSQNSENVSKFFPKLIHLDFCFLGALYDSSWCPHRMLFLRIWISPQVGVLSQLFWLWLKIHSLLVLRNSYPYFYGTGCWYNFIHLDSWKQNLEILEKNRNLLDFTQRYAHAIFIT